MIRPLLTTALCAAFAAACTPSRPPVVVVPEATPTKRIVRAGSDLVLPDSTRVTPDQTGGFQLPNGDYVRRDARGALVLPNGSRCVPDGGGYACP